VGLEEATMPLAGWRVLEASEGIAGAYATKLLADQGAEVIKLESPNGGDPLRWWNAARPDEAPAETGALFTFLNAGKQSVAAGDATLSARLASWADVIIIGPGGSDLLGASVPGRGDNRPSGPCVVTISPFSTEPWGRHAPVNELTLQGWCGLLSACGTTDGQPLQMGAGVGQWATGALAALAALAGREWAARTGREGTEISVGATEAMAVCLLNYPTLYREFTGNPSALSRGYGDWPSVVRCRDGWIGLCIFTAQQWADFAAMIGRSDLAGDERLNSMGGRSRNRQLARSVIEPWLAEHTPEEIHELCGLYRVPVALIGNGKSVLEMDHFAQRGVFADNPAGFRQPRPPIRLSRAPRRAAAAAPVPGADTVSVGVRLADRRRVAADRREIRGPDRTKPLSGLTIVDLTAFWAGPAASHLLCTLGADVIKIESHKRPDGMRYATVARPTDPDWLERSPTFHATNPAKRSVCIDFSTPSGRELLLRLAGLADAVIENFTPRVMDNAGLTYDEFRRRREDIIFVRMPGFGVDGPWRDHSGFAQTMEQVSGVGWLTGQPDGEPVIRSTMDPVTGIHAAFALLAALEHRRRTGLGQLIEVPMAEVALNVAAEQVITYTAYGHVQHPQGNRGPAAPQGVYRCTGDDQWVVLAVETDAHWQALCQVTGRPSWAEDHEYACRVGRRRHHDALDRELATWFEGRDRDRAVEQLLDAGVPAAPVWNHMLLDQLPQLVSSGFFQRLVHPVVGQVALPGIGLRSPDIDFSYEGPAPTLGQHTTAVLREKLGCTDAELRALVAEGAIGPLG
jgi:crotonobetainyl-CoA:carnitine CoA-transferase CaiB-like acyl-CoA transferase